MSTPSNTLKKRLAIAAGCVLLMSSGCATFDVRKEPRPYQPPLYPAVAWDCEGLEMFTTEGTTAEAAWAIFLFGVCDLPFSLVTDTLCLPLDLVCWCCQEKKPDSGKDGADTQAPHAQTPNP